MARLCPLFSGSSGNSYYIGSRDAGVLIDAGRSAKQLTAALAACGIAPNAVKGILITHEHTDHISALRVFAAKHKTPVFASPLTVLALQDNGHWRNSYPLHIFEQDLQLAGLTVQSFPTPHDSVESLGFRLTTADQKTLGFATDLGFLSGAVTQGLSGCDYAVIESNHDIAMLQTGAYPYSLKRRILSEQGHLSNKDCAAYLPQLFSTGTRKFLLAHLSGENNTPDIAYQSALCAMTLQGYVKDVDFTLGVAPKDNHKGAHIIF